LRLAGDPTYQFRDQFPGAAIGFKPMPDAGKDISLCVTLEQEVLVTLYGV
jgi:hypothetical protein